MSSSYVVICSSNLDFPMPLPHQCPNDCLLFSRLNGGELFDYVIEREFLEESQAVDYLTQIMEAMHFCHKKNIVHLDLKVCS